MDCLTYQQMIGRAGRKGIDTEGESILICKEAEKQKVATLVQGQPEPVKSCLTVSGSEGKLASSMKRAILEVIVSGAATTKADVATYASCTLFASQMAQTDGHNSGQEDTIAQYIKFLEKNEFISLQYVVGSTSNKETEKSVRYVATQLGLACLSSSLSPDEGLHVFCELQRARREFVLENDLHIIYQIVPIYALVSLPRINWMSFLDMWDKLSDDMRLVGKLVGVDETWMSNAVNGTISIEDNKHAKALAIHQRFYTALALHDLVNELSLSNVTAKYGGTKGITRSRICHDTRLITLIFTYRDASVTTTGCCYILWDGDSLLLKAWMEQYASVGRTVSAQTRVWCQVGTSRPLPANFTKCE